MYVYVRSLCMQENDMHLWWCLVESVIKKTTVNRQRWIVPALVSDASMLTCTCMSSGRHAYMYMCILSVRMY